MRPSLLGGQCNGEDHITPGPAALRDFNPAYVGSGCWSCENSSAGRVRRISRRNCVSRESNLAAYIWLDAVQENSIFHMSLMYECLHRCAGRPARSRWCKSTTMKV